MSNPYAITNSKVSSYVSAGGGVGSSPSSSGGSGGGGGGYGGGGGSGGGGGGGYAVADSNGVNATRGGFSSYEAAAA